MKIIIDKPYKSLSAVQAIILPELTIITGINGAGKTHLLSGISIGAIHLINDDGTPLALPGTKNCRYIPSNSLSPNDSVTVNNTQLTQQVNQIWNQYSDFIVSRQTNPNITFSQYDIKGRQQRIIEHVAKQAKKDIVNLDHNDFYDYFPIYGLEQQDIFYQNFSNLFKRYYDKYEENLYRQFLYEFKGDKDAHFLNNEDFLRINGEAPWSFVNEILTESKLDFYINSPIKLHRDTPFELKLVNSLTQAEVQFSELSSGEKVLMSLALALYNSNLDAEFPDVLLMDEPDASLHPSMSKQFLDVIERVFVNGKGVKVIITTHSPSTVALAKEASLFVINKATRKIEKTTKDKALRILTEGVPSFSINYENRRQVFVEGPYDVKYYEGLYQRLSNLLVPEVSLSFISSGDSRTNGNGMAVATCDQVISITSILRQAGNRFIWGVIDWDGKNVSSEFVKVLGDGSRYSMENYLFDPILVSALLLREKILSRQELGLLGNQHYTDFKGLTQAQLQAISDFMIQKVADVLMPQENEFMSAKYVSGLELQIPKWYLHHQGHELEGYLKKVFPKLNRFSKEDAMKMEIIEKVIDEIPEFIPQDILTLYQTIQKG